MTKDIIDQTINLSQPRETARVTFKDGVVLEGAVGTTIDTFLKAYFQHQGIKEANLMGGVLDGRLRELAYPVNRDSTLEPVTLASSDGGRIYRRSLIMLLSVAIDELFPSQRVRVSYALPEGAFFCQLPNRPPFDEDELEAVDAHMRQIVAEDSAITKRIAPLDEVVELFSEREEDDKLRLMEQRTRNMLTLYELHGREDYHYGYMLPSTGYLRYFKLIPVDGGFLLQYPRKENPETLGPIKAYSKLSRVFRQADNWLERMGVQDIGQLNRIVREDRVHELILVAEALHERHIAQIASDIRAHYNEKGARLVLIAGPSSSGKTTFAKRLAIQLLAHGLRPFTLELDNYFVNRELTPRDSRGEYDFESLGAINRALFNEHLLMMMAGKQVQLPRFDFIKGLSTLGRQVELTSNQIILVEGIHGLNPDLVPDIPPEKIFRVYVSALTQLNTDAHNRIPTTDVRLLRRMVRDAQHRGYNAVDTITRWPSVRNGEKLNIFPYQENADAMFNSALVYELAALRLLAEPLLLQVEPGTPPHIEANRLLSFLRWVQPLSLQQVSFIPDTSLLREFIGASSLHNYHPGEIFKDGIDTIKD